MKTEQVAPNITAESLGHGVFILRGHKGVAKWGDDYSWVCNVIITNYHADIKALLALEEHSFTIKDAISIRDWLYRKGISTIVWDKSAEYTRGGRRYDI